MMLKYEYEDAIGMRQYMLNATEKFLIMQADMQCKSTDAMSAMTPDQSLLLCAGM